MSLMLRLAAVHFRRTFRRNLDNFRQNLEEVSYSAKCCLGEMSFRRNVMGLFFFTPFRYVILFARLFVYS